jgi:NAD(P)-dependent dehydrogenase (short-subunit alcohol dehydrogenase family)
MSIPATKDLLDFTGKTVIVTGSGSGLGQGIAMRFGEAGANVVVNYLRSEAGARALAQAIEKLGRRAIAIQADVTNRIAVETLIAGTVAEFGRLDVLVNNAGVYPLASLADMKDEEWDLVVDSNLRSTFLCTQVAARHMIAGGEGGAVVNIASVEGESPAPMHSHYNAAKGGVLMHTRAAANELGVHGIRVNAVSPGLIWREGLDESWPDGVQRWKKAAPLGRLGMADDVADACLFLASPAARWITGVNLRVDGGVLSRPSF